MTLVFYNVEPVELQRVEEPEGLISVALEKHKLRVTTAEEV